MSLTKITEYLIEDLGVEHTQYFQGISTANTKWDDGFVGIGESAYDALEDALECAASIGFDVENIENKLSPICDINPENDDLVHYVAFYLKRIDND